MSDHNVLFTNSIGRYEIKEGVEVTPVYYYLSTNYI